MRKMPREEIERAARLYKSNKDASLTLGITLAGLRSHLQEI